MSLPPPSSPSGPEWELQERAREEERGHAPATGDAQVKRYRLIARVLGEPLRQQLPQDFAASVLAAPARGTSSAAAPRLGVLLIVVGAAYLAVLGVAALLMRAEIRHALASLDQSIVLVALAAFLSQAAPRCAALIRRLRPQRAPGV